MSQSEFSLPDHPADPDTSGANLAESAQIARLIDHALLRPELTVTEVRQGCALADRYRVASVCVRPSDVALARSELAASPVEVGTVIGFPHGSTSTAAKLAEARAAIADGARELDMVLHIGRLRGGDDTFVADDVAAVVQVARAADAAGDPADRILVKVILETAYLSNDEIVRACRLAEAAGADYVKTSTGFAPSGASVEAVRLMRATVSSRLGVKASGGIRDLRTARAMIDAGATRLGTTSTAAILDEART